MSWSLCPFYSVLFSLELYSIGSWPVSQALCPGRGLDPQLGTSTIKNEAIDITNSEKIGPFIYFPS